MNFPSKSREDLQKIQFDIQLVLTEQRAQRVDLARVIQLTRSVLQQFSDKKSLEDYDNSIPTLETEVD